MSHASHSLPLSQPERTTQNRVIALFRDQLNYRYLGNWQDRPLNSNVEEGLVTAYTSSSMNSSTCSNAPTTTASSPTWTNYFPTGVTAATN